MFLVTAAGKEWSLPGGRTHSVYLLTRPPRPQAAGSLLPQFLRKMGHEDHAPHRPPHRFPLSVLGSSVASLSSRDLGKGVPQASGREPALVPVLGAAGRPSWALCWG